MNSKKTHLVVDMLYDFIEGSLACENALSAVENSVQHINSNRDQSVLYIADSHPSNHCSFVENGGVWPPHCVQGTRGAEIHSHFYNNIDEEFSKPNENNIFLKGCDSTKEQYSGFEAFKKDGKSISEFLRGEDAKEIIISGIATEYCVKETVKDLLREGFKVTVIQDALAYVTKEGSVAAIKELMRLGATII